MFKCQPIVQCGIMSPPGKVMMCKFDDHDGPHLSLWMTSEAKMKSVESIKNFVGKHTLTYATITEGILYLK
jgi:hypothetical protein